MTPPTNRAIRGGRCAGVRATVRSIGTVNLAACIVPDHHPYSSLPCYLFVGTQLLAPLTCPHTPTHPHPVLDVPLQKQKFKGVFKRFGEVAGYTPEEVAGMKFKHEGNILTADDVRAPPFFPARSSPHWAAAAVASLAHTMTAP